MELYIFGAGGHGRVVADIAVASGETDIRFIDRDWPAKKQNGSWPVLAKDAESLPEGSRIVVAIGDNAKRRATVEALKAKKLQFPNLVHPSAVVSLSAQIGFGTVVMPMAVINAGARIGPHVIINTSASVDHDCVLEDFVHISPGANLAGGVHVGTGSWIGIGSAVRENCLIGSDVVVAAGACVVKNVAPGQKVFGIPAVVKG